jgi:single-stranded-DNA-specific exonuclease
MQALPRYQWKLRPVISGGYALARELGCGRLLGDLLAARGYRTIESAERFLSPSYDQLPDALLLPDADKAVTRIVAAIRDRELILIHGDYDSDGVSSAALWFRLLTKLGADVRVHVPHRCNDGYDMRPAFVDRARSEGARLIITCDCGIRRAEEVRYAAGLGIDVVVTDHHEPGDELPPACAVVNPHRRDSKYPFADLAGVGVSFRLGEALVERLGMPVAGYRRAYSDLAAIGTVTDVMPLLSDNRVIVHQGLQSLRSTQKVGLQALLAVSSIPPARPLVSDDIGFGIGPRINAIGRIGDARTALDLMLTREMAEAEALAEELNHANISRRTTELRILEEAIEKIEAAGYHQQPFIVVSSTEWHRGIVGIVANRIAERYWRPTAMIAIEKGANTARGSARSIPGFDLHQAISTGAEHLRDFGGHSAAAGFSLEADRIGRFRAAMVENAGRSLQAEDLVPSLQADLEVDADELTVPGVAELSRMQPWGSGNEDPLCVVRGLEITDCFRIGKERNHLKLRFRTARHMVRDGVWWSMAEHAAELKPGDLVDICCRLQVNRYDERESVQFVLRDIRPQTAEPSGRRP